jgi:hypothetical protein
MELALALSQLWQRKVLLGLGVVVAVLAGFVSHEALKSTVYSAATTQMVVDSPHSALGNVNDSLDPFTARAGVFAQLMTTPEALDAIGQAAGIPGNKISAQGPADSAPELAQPAIPQSTTSTSTPFKLLLNQDPTLPTVDIYAEAPTTAKAVALANGAVTGFATYLRSIAAQGSVPTSQQVEIRELGAAVGGVVDPGTSTKLAALAVIGTFLVWCGVILLVLKLRATTDGARKTRSATLARNGHLDDRFFDGSRSFPLSEYLTEQLSVTDGEADHAGELDQVHATSRSHRTRDEA